MRLGLASACFYCVNILLLKRLLFDSIFSVHIRSRVPGHRLASPISLPGEAILLGRVFDPQGMMVTSYFMS